MNPIVANNRPVKVDLTEGKEYYFCACGRSNKQPFCDGSHVGTEFKPKPFTAEKSGDAFLCQCKHSANLPFCDGTHKQFDASAIGKEGPGIKARASEIPVASATVEEPTVEFIHQLARDGLANSAMQSIGCVAARMSNTNNCPAGIATQKADLRQRLNVEKSAGQLRNFFEASVELMQVMARACGHDSLSSFSSNDLATWHRDMALLSGVKYSGFIEP